MHLLVPISLSFTHLYAYLLAHPGKPCADAMAASLPPSQLPSFVQNTGEERNAIDARHGEADTHAANDNAAENVGPKWLAIVPYAL